MIKENKPFTIARAGTDRSCRRDAAGGDLSMARSASGWQRDVRADGAAADICRARRIRVCHVVVRPSLDGAQRSMLELCLRLDPSRYDVSVICSGAGPLTEALARHAIRIHPVPALVSPMRPHKDLLALGRIMRICRRERFDLLHTHTSKGGFIGRIGARLAGVPGVIHHVRGYAFHGESRCYERWFYSGLEAIASRFADKMIFVNHEERELAIERGLVCPSKALTIRNGIALERFDPVRNMSRRGVFRRQHGIADDEVAILVCGRIERQKQSLILPEIAAALHAWAPLAKWRMLVVGEGSYEERLRAAILRRRIGHRLQLLGWQADPSEATCAADIALLPSLWEGLPRVLLEAHAAGIPTVASDIKGNREVVMEETGVLCRPKVAGDYAAALYGLMQSRPDRERMGQAALARAREQFCLHRLHDEVVGVYEALVSAKGLSVQGGEGASTAAIQSQPPQTAAGRAMSAGGPQTQ
jgi:glycosyltransferase involved in cell wall biosynthesis